MWGKFRRGLLVGLTATLLVGCVVVPQNRRRYLADPTMLPEEGLDDQARRKLHTSREAAGGGDGKPAGGGCGCGN